MRHLLERPTWTCAVDGQPWPCGVAKLELEVDHGHGLVLATYMGGMLEVAIRELPDVAPGEVHRRLLGWVRARPSSTDYPTVDQGKALPLWTP